VKPYTWQDVQNDITFQTSNGSLNNNFSSDFQRIGSCLYRKRYSNTTVGSFPQIGLTGGQLTPLYRKGVLCFDSSLRMGVSYTLLLLHTNGKIFDGTIVSPYNLTSPTIKAIAFLP
jgi:hypothetical protein